MVDMALNLTKKSQTLVFLQHKPKVAETPESVSKCVIMPVMRVSEKGVYVCVCMWVWHPLEPKLAKKKVSTVQREREREREKERERVKQALLYANYECMI